MIRSVASVAAAILVVFPVIGLAQQELSDTSESARPEPRSSPEALAVREGVADALQGVVAPRKTAYDLPSGTWGIISEGSNGGGIFSDSDGTGYAWLGYDRPSGTDLGGTANAGEYGVYAGGNKAGGYFEAEDSTGYAYIGDLNRGIKALGSFAGGQFADSDGTGYAWLAYDRPSGTDPAASRTMASTARTRPATMPVATSKTATGRGMRTLVV